MGCCPTILSFDPALTAELSPAKEKKKKKALLMVCSTLAPLQKGFAAAAKDSARQHLHVPSGMMARCGHALCVCVCVCVDGS